ncbi:hypothetical protein [Pseudomonas sp. CMR5c]|uniref:hypothetical protein n=1 Tax=Pseudomonas sp. CMR5c TaxID=658630 RepID=UPI00069E00FA|nr:hypothetical protein [Pseudomonas sp. CMR5c]AZC20262.1 hypothetical protein C4K40_4895 [Pseudomonas sp. CMR5c]
MSSTDQDHLPDPMPGEVAEFIAAAIVTGDLELPDSYPTLGEWARFQIGYRSHGLTGESLVASTCGAWQPGWYVIARNYFDDPFFIDIHEQAAGFPVYFARHGAGHWEATMIAPSLQGFAQLLSALHDLAPASPQALHLIENETDLALELWREVHRQRSECDQPAEPDAEQQVLDQSLYQRGQLLVTHIGPQKIKVVKICRAALDVPLAQALALAQQDEILVGSGLRIRLLALQEQLQAAGATVEFRPDGEPVP